MYIATFFFLLTVDLVSCCDFAWLVSSVIAILFRRGDVEDRHFLVETVAETIAEASATCPGRHGHVRSCSVRAPCANGTHP